MTQETQPDAAPSFSPRVLEIVNRIRLPLDIAEVSRQLVKAQNELRKLTEGANEMLNYIAELEDANEQLETQLGAAVARLAELEAATHPAQPDSPPGAGP